MKMQALTRRAATKISDTCNHQGQPDILAPASAAALESLAAGPSPCRAGVWTVTARYGRNRRPRAAPVRAR